MNDKSFTAVVIGLIIGIVLGLIVGTNLMGTKMRHEAISLGYAEYNPTNATFQWK